MVASKAIDLNHYLHQKKPLWNILAILYTLSSYGIAIGLILLPSGWLNVIGVILLTHTLTISAYLAHECMHGNVFSNMLWNAVGGNLMLWLNGSCYIRFRELMRMHIAHHVNRIDYCRFDIAAFLQSIPAPLRLTFLGLEWLYFPSLAFLLRIGLMLAPFRQTERKDERLRVTLIALVRGFLFTVLGIVSFKALVLYFLAYIGMTHILRFMDAFQHTYESLPVGVPLPKHIQQVSPEEARAYEQANTFSNIISNRYRWLNLLLLNFGYHNAHHELMKCPWYHLPELDRELYFSNKNHYITLLELLGNYHRFRLSRIFTGQGETVENQGNRQLETFYGAIEVSFLVVPFQVVIDE